MDRAVARVLAYRRTGVDWEFGMAVRSGDEFIDGLRRNPREVWVAGRRVDDVTADPVFARPVRALAMLYDLQCDPANRDVMTHTEDGETFGTAFMVPRDRNDLAKRRKAFKVWGEASFGLLGRSPDFLNTVLMACAENPDFFGQRGAQFADNVRNYYRHCRASDLFATHAIVNPQADRSRPSHEQADPFAHLGVVEETKDGLIVRGAKMLATHGPTADELLVYPEPGIREGSDRYVLAFGIPCATKGLKFICREPFDDGSQNPFDHPLGSRFEEPDAVCVFDDVLIPWNRVFLYGDVKAGNALFSEAGIRNNTGHQTAVRGLAKCQLMVGIVVALTQAVKSDVHLHVAQQLGECLAYLPLIEGAIMLAEQKAEPTGRGAIRPAYEPLQALRLLLPKFYERMVQVTQTLAAGGLLISPTEADLRSAVGSDIERYYKGAGVDAEERIRLFKLAWDATGTQFGQRMLHYERYYAGDPVRVSAAYRAAYDVRPLLAMVQRALAGQ
jgi:4-hydroxyphenylacetate 3-monooxygenase oxygenase component